MTESKFVDFGPVEITHITTEEDNTANRDHKQVHITGTDEDIDIRFTGSSKQMDSFHKCHMGKQFVLRMVEVIE